MSLKEDCTDPKPPSFVDKSSARTSPVEESLYSKLGKEKGLRKLAEQMVNKMDIPHDVLTKLLTDVT